MGKRIVIKEADFSVNAIGNVPIGKEEVWYTSHKNNYENRPIDTSVGIVTFNQQSKYWSFNEEDTAKYRRKSINAVRFIPHGFTTLNIYKAMGLTGSGSIGNPIATIEIDKEGDSFVVCQFNSIVLGENEYLAFDNGSYVLTAQPYDDQTFYRKVGSSEVDLFEGSKRTVLLIDFGYIE